MTWFRAALLVGCASVALCVSSAHAQRIQLFSNGDDESRSRAGQEAWEAVLAQEVESSLYVKLRSQGQTFDLTHLRRFATSPVVDERRLAMVLLGEETVLTETDIRAVIGGLQDSDSAVRAFALSTVMRRGQVFQPRLLEMVADEAAAYEKTDSSGGSVVVRRSDVATFALLNIRQVDEASLWRLALEDVAADDAHVPTSDYASPVANPTTPGRRALLILATRGRNVDQGIYSLAASKSDRLRFAATNVIARSSSTPDRLANLKVLATDGNQHVRGVAMSGLADTGPEGASVLMELLQSENPTIVRDALDVVEPDTPGLLEKLRPLLSDPAMHDSASWYLLVNSIAPGWSIGEGKEPIPREALQPIVVQLNESDFWRLRFDHDLWDRLRPDLATKADLAKRRQMRSIKDWLETPGGYLDSDSLRTSDVFDYPELTSRLVEYSQGLLEDARRTNDGGSASDRNAGDHLQGILNFLMRDQVFAILGETQRDFVVASAEAWIGRFTDADSFRNSDDYTPRARFIPDDLRGQCAMFAVRFWDDRQATHQADHRVSGNTDMFWRQATELARCGDVKERIETAALDAFVSSRGGDFSALSTYGAIVWNPPARMAKLFADLPAVALDRIAEALIEEQSDLTLPRKLVTVALRAGPGARERLINVANSDRADNYLRRDALDALTGWNTSPMDEGYEKVLTPALLPGLSPQDQERVRLQVIDTILTQTEFQKSRLAMLRLPVFSDSERLSVLREWLAKSIADPELAEASQDFVDVWLESGGTLQELLGDEVAAVDADRCSVVLQLAGQLPATSAFRRRVVDAWLRPSAWTGMYPDLKPAWSDRDADGDADDRLLANRNRCLADAVSHSLEGGDGLEVLAKAVADGMPLYALRSLGSFFNRDQVSQVATGLAAPLSKDSPLRIALWNRLLASDQLASLPVSGINTDRYENFVISELLFGHVIDVGPAEKAGLSRQLHAVANQLERAGDLKAAWRLRSDAVALSIATGASAGAEEMADRGWASGRRTGFPLGAPVHGSIIPTNSAQPSASPSVRKPLPAIPWPPPSGFRAEELPRLASVLKTRSQQAAQDALVQVIESADEGYEWGLFGGPPEGFAIISRIERIDQRGKPSEGAARWTTEGAARLSAESFVRDLFFQEAGYFRVIVFVVSGDRNVLPGPSRALPTSSTGARALPVATAMQPFGDRSATALVYAFKRGKGAAVEPWLDGPSARQHLAASGLTRELELIVARLEKASVQIKQ